MMRTFVLTISGILTGCTSLPPADTFTQPIGFSTYGRTADGQRVRLWTDYQPAPRPERLAAKACG